MICSHCASETTTEPCGTCGASPLLDGRYRLDAVIGEGGSGVTYRATRLADGHPVCVKELAFRALRSFDPERLFRREAAVLRQLDHRQIPAYLDDFGAGEGRSLALYLVQELVDGQSLADELAAHRYTEREVLDLLDELLGILDYLHGLAPPVIHRDLKPSNVLRRRSDGRLVLIDFGSVKDTVAASVTGSATVAGTFGYMAPEQLYGTATEASDLYAVGVIGVVLLSRREPAELLDREQHLTWRPHVRASPETEALLDRLTRRDPVERPASAAAARTLVVEARAGLDAPARPTPVSTPAPPAPHPAAAPGGVRQLAFVAFLAFLALVTVVAFVTSSGSDSEGTVTAEVCPDCEPLSEPFLDGLRFGMTVDEARAARKELAGVRLEHTKPSDSFVSLGLYVPTDTLVERDELVAKLLFEGEPATCTLSFGDGIGLGRVSCKVGLVDAAAESRYASKVEAVLARRYGMPVERGQGLGRIIDWSSPDGTLALREHASPPAVTVKQFTTAWDDAGRRAERDAEARKRAEKERERAARKAALDAERARLEGLRGDAAP